MDKKKRNIVIFVILCVLLIMIGVGIFIDIFSNDDTNNLIICNQDDGVTSDENIKSESTEDNITNNTGDDVNYGNIINNYENDKTENVVNNSGNIQNNYGEEDVVSYFESMEYDVENSTSFKEKFKEYFVIIVDFIFYDKEIKGYTFSGLTGTAKAKIVAFALKIDTKIDEYVPGYKENISSTTGKVYTDIKEKLVTSYMDISSTVCKNNEDECNKVKDIFSDVKSYCKIGWDFIKGLVKSGVTKLKDWYEIYSGK